MSTIRNKAGAGTLDPNFGANGVVDLSTEAVPTRPYDIFALSGDKFLYADEMPGNPIGIRLRRMHANGFFDISFGDRGQVEISFIPGNIQHLKLTNYLSSGLMLTCAFNEGEQLAPHAFVMRLDLEGKPVSSFGENGRKMLDVWKLIVSKETRADNIECPALDLPYFISVTSSVLPDGKILLLYGLRPAYGDNPILIRLLPNGELDKSFNGTGYTVITPNETFNQSIGYCLVVQQDGKILVSGYYRAASDIGAFVMRTDANGRFDTSFNGGLAVTVDDPSYEFHFAGSMSVRTSDGTIVVAGYSGPNKPSTPNGSGFVTLLNANGTPNQTFNGGRPLFSAMIPEGVKWEYCAWQDDAIIVGGSGGNSRSPVLMARFRLNGILDPLFNNQGWASYQPESKQALYQGMTMTHDHKLGLCVRVVAEAPSTSCHVLRYLTA